MYDSKSCNEDPPAPDTGTDTDDGSGGGSTDED